MDRLMKNLFLTFLILFLISAAFSLLPVQQKKELSIRELVLDINQAKVKEISVVDDQIEIVYKDGELASSRKESGVSFHQMMVDYGVDREKLDSVNIKIKEVSRVWDWLGPLLIFGVLPLLSLFIFFWFIFRQARVGASQAFDFTRARARIFGAGTQPKEKISFNDVGGLREAKEELKEVVDFLKNPKKYLQIGAKIPRGVLLIGAPGTGKTLLARAVAFEAGVPFFSISGSEFVELFVGVGASRVRSLFEQAKKAGRAIIFIDEIDAIGRVRGPAITGAHEEREQTLNQILAEMDGFERADGRIIVSATNRPDMLDPALLRPGRFDRRIILDLPDINEREEILEIHCRKKPLSLNINLREIAERTPGFSGADLENVVNEAAILAARKNKTQIFQEEFLESIDKVLLGPERKSHVLSKKEKEIAAYHEAGHALTAASLPGAEPVRKISIVARGLAAGYTLKMPIEERRIKSKKEFLAEIMALFGGYCAERVKFGEISTGAANDLKEASILIRKLVKEYGMSSLGPITFGEKEEYVFLGREFGEYKNYSEKIAEKIDKEVLKITKESERKVNNILKNKKRLLEKIAKRLIEKETIEKEEFENLVGKGRKKLIKIKRGT